MAGSRPDDSLGRDIGLLLDADDVRRDIDLRGRGRPGSGVSELPVPGDPRRTDPLLVALPVVGLSVSRRSAGGGMVSAQLALFPARRFSACDGCGTLAARVPRLPRRVFPGVALSASSPSCGSGGALLWALRIFHRPQFPYRDARRRGLDAVAAAVARPRLGIASVALHDSRWPGSGNTDSRRPLSNQLV